MKLLVKISPLLLLAVCCTEKKTSPYPDADFADRVVNFAIESYSSQYIELPELYPEPARLVPEEKDDHSILADKLQLRGFQFKNVSTANFPLQGRRIRTMVLENESCRCEVGKIYYSTGNIAEYLRTERIKCAKK
ncbi:hypothetical protein [Flavobacterium sp.]|uniref:hypothetical protein n=1 Tax=Flavobacterium sp. TaxID=239 RepID=UPI0039E68F70